MAAVSALFVSKEDARGVCSSHCLDGRLPQPPPDAATLRPFGHRHLGDFELARRHYDQRIASHCSAGPHGEQNPVAAFENRLPRSWSDSMSFASSAKYRTVHSSLSRPNASSSPGWNLRMTTAFPGVMIP